MTISTTLHHVTDPVGFAELQFALPANSLVFLAAKGQRGPGAPPGVLLFAGIHYTVLPEGQFTLADFLLNAGDILAVVTFAS